MTSEYEKETGKELVFKSKRGRPKVDGEVKEWDIRLTPSDQVEVDFSALEMEDFKILLVCKEGEPNGTPRLHYHMFMRTARSDNYVDNLLNKLGKANATVKGNAIFSKRKAHEGTQGYVVKGGQVCVRHGLNDQFLTEIFERSENYKKDKEKERKKESRAKNNFLADILKEPEVKRLQSPAEITAYILQRFKQNNVRFPSRGTVESAVMYLLYDHQAGAVVEYYTPRLFSQY